MCSVSKFFKKINFPLHHEFATAVQKKFLRAHGGRMSTAFVRWIPPPINWIKLNIGESINLMQGKIGVGASLRESDGSWQGCFTYNIVMCDVELAEFWG